MSPVIRLPPRGDARPRRPLDEKPECEGGRVSAGRPFSPGPVVAAVLWATFTVLTLVFAAWLLLASLLTGAMMIADLARSSIRWVKLPRNPPDYRAAG